MSQIYVYKNSLNKNEVDVIDTDNILYDFLKVKKQFPQAKIYLRNPCPENDITPSLKDKASIARLTEISDDCSIVCHPGELSSFVTWVATKILGSAVSALVKVPKPNSSNSTSTGSSNNNLSDPENKQRLKQRIPFILGRVKAIPDLFAPVIKYFKDGVEVEETLMCLCENHVQVSAFKSGDTPIQEIPGTSVSAYGHNQSIVGSNTIFKWGDTFDQPPVIARQNASINGQTLLSPNSTRIEAGDIYFQYPNLIKANDQRTADKFNSFDVNDSLS